MVVTSAEKGELAVISLLLKWNTFVRFRLGEMFSEFLSLSSKPSGLMVEGGRTILQERVFIFPEGE